MKFVKAVIYGEPGVGKSTFVLGAPKPFYITTDGNYEYLLDFGAKEDAHKQVFDWAQCKAVFKDIETSNDYDNYDTIIIDLVEDMFKWCEYEFCASNKLTHVSDLGWGKGYDITRNEFFIEIAKLLNLEKNVFLISHGMDTVVKDRRGVEHTKHIPSTRVPDKVWDMIEGRVKFFSRCYLKGEEQEDGTMIKKRYLSIIPKENEFGICRGLNENSVPHDIPLDFATFAQIINLEKADKAKKVVKEPKVEEVKVAPVKVEEPVINLGTPKISVSPTPAVEPLIEPINGNLGETEVKIDIKPNINDINNILAKKVKEVEEVKPEPVKIEKGISEVEMVKPANDNTQSEQLNRMPQSLADKIAEINAIFKK